MTFFFLQHTLLIYASPPSDGHFHCWFSSLLFPESTQSGMPLNKCNDPRQSHCHHPLPLREEDKGRSVCMYLHVTQLVSHWTFLFLKPEAYDSHTNTILELRNSGRTWTWNRHNTTCERWMIFIMFLIWICRFTIRDIKTEPVRAVNMLNDLLWIYCVLSNLPQYISSLEQL